MVLVTSSIMIGFDKCPFCLLFMFDLWGVEKGCKHKGHSNIYRFFYRCRIYKAFDSYRALFARLCSKA